MTAVSAPPETVATGPPNPKNKAAVDASRAADGNVRDVAAVVSVPRLLSAAEVGKVLGVSAQTVRRRIHEGELPAVLDHGRLVVRGDELRAFIDGLERVGQSPRRFRPPAQRGRFGWLGAAD
jgi:excisionase family DNA binding protein